MLITKFALVNHLTRHIHQDEKNLYCNTASGEEYMMIWHIRILANDKDYGTISSPSLRKI